MSDPTYTPPTPPGSNAGWSNVHNPTPGAPVPPAGSYQAGQYPPPGQYPPQGQYPPPGYPAGQYPPPVAASGLSSGVAAGLCYLFWPVAIVFLIIEPYKRDPLVRFSAMQMLTMAAVGIGLSFLHIFLIFFHIPFLGIIISLAFVLVWLAIGICWLIAMIKAFTRQRWSIPVIGDLAQKFSGQVNL